MLFNLFKGMQMEARAMVDQGRRLPTPVVPGVASQAVELDKAFKQAFNFTRFLNGADTTRKPTQPKLFGRLY